MWVWQGIQGGLALKTIINMHWRKENGVVGIRNDWRTGNAES